MGFGFWVLSFGSWVLGFKIGLWVLSFRFWVLGFGVSVLGFGVWSLGFRVRGVKFGVEECGLRVAPKHPRYVVLTVKRHDPVEAGERKIIEPHSGLCVQIPDFEDGHQALGKSRGVLSAHHTTIRTPHCAIVPFSTPSGRTSCTPEWFHEKTRPLPAPPPPGPALAPPPPLAAEITCAPREL